MGMRRISAILFFFGLFSLNAQDIRTVNGRKFKVHIVQSQETLYALSRKYQIPVDSIMVFNPQATGVLSLGMEILIPQPNAPSSPKVAVAVKEHVVQSGETMYGITRMYDISEASLRAANPNLGDVLRIGQRLVIPVEAFTAISSGKKGVEMSDTTLLNRTSFESSKHITLGKCDSNNAFQIPVKVALLLPLQSGGNHMRAAVEYLAGFRFVADSLARMGASVKLMVFDFSGRGDKQKLTEILAHPFVAESGLIVGPFFPDALAEIMAFSQVRNIPVANPFSRNADLLQKHPGLIRMAISAESSRELLIRHLHKKHPSAKFILYAPKLSYLDSLVALDYSRILSENQGRGLQYVKTASYPSGQFELGKQNILILPMSSELPVKNLLTQLFSGSIKNDLIVVGMESWIDFQFISINYYTQMQLHIPVTEQFHPFIPELKKFRQWVRDEYQIEPSLYAHRGYEHAAYFLTRMVYLGSAAPECPLSNERLFYGTRFRFIGNRERGWECKRGEYLMLGDFPYYNLVAE
jgi:LysM repeat protein